MDLNIHAGHNPDNKVACGALGLIKESTGNREVKNELINILKPKTNNLYDCTCDNGTSVSDVINKIVTKCNSHSVDLDVSIHFNCGVSDKTGDGKTSGVEVLVYKMSGPAYEAAVRICKEIEALGYKNRGVKQRTDLAFLKRTKSPALLIECCFVDDKDDIDLYNPKSMAKAIAQGILNKKISTSVPSPTPIPHSEVFYRAISGSFSNKEYALDRKSKLDKDGFSGVFLEAFVKDEKTWYRVIAGSFKDKNLAEQRVKNLSAKGYDGGFVTAFRK